MNLFLKVTSRNFVSRYPELHHYTTAQGLAGICGSRTLWATNYRDLNDTKEAVQLRAPLEKVMTERFELLLRKLSKQHQSVRRAIVEIGPSIPRIAADQARKMVKSYYDTMFRKKASLDPYVISFCTHSKDYYATENGLLSQWRGYGAVGSGYAIVFDTKKLIELLKKEFNAHYWVMSLRLDKVHYHTADISIDAIFGPLLREAEKLFSAIIMHTSIPEKAMGYFLWAAPLLKHQGFKEENEVRIVGIPATPHDLRALRRQHPRASVPPFNTIRSRTSPYGNVKYIALFETLSCTLPIKRVIVGPCRDQQQSYRHALKVVGKAIPLVCSETPFLV